MPQNPIPKAATNSLSSSNGSSTVPLLAGGRDGDGREREERWWKALVTVDLKESKDQLLFSLPMILTNLSYYLIPLISVMFAGHLGDLELAGSTLANSWATVTGVSFMIGLSGALETLCGQTFGAKIYGLMGIYLQASCLISILFSILVAVMWWYTEPILIFLHQSSEVSQKAALYMKYLIPGIFAYGCLQNILRFLQTQSVVSPLVVCSMIPLVCHAGITYLLVHLAGLGYKGAPLAASVSYWISLLMLALYVCYAKKFEHTWKGLSMESFRYVFSNLKLAMPSAAMVCLEYWAFEILVLLAGLMPNAEATTSLIALWYMILALIESHYSSSFSKVFPVRLSMIVSLLSVNTEAIAYMLSYGLSAAASTRVSNELGAGNPDRAKHAMGVSLKLSILLGLLVDLALGFGSSLWASFFTDNVKIIEAFSSLSILLVISIFFDSIQGVLSGVSRGCGWQHLAMYTNMATFYLVGMPISCLLAFQFGFYAKGLWIGLICGLSCQAGTLFMITCLKRWTGAGLSVNGTDENPSDV